MALAWALVGAVVLTTSAGHMLYDTYEIVPSEFFEFASRLATLAAIWYWFWRYAQAHRLALPFDSGLYLSMAPFIVIPVFVFRAQRWRGLVPLACLAFLYAGLPVVVWAVYDLATAFSG
jgi:hypothetical protein